MSLSDDFPFGPDNVAATLRGIHPDYSPLLDVVIQRVALFELFQLNHDFQIGYTGISVQGWPNALSFTLRFENWKKRRALCISLCVRAEEKVFSVWIENRAGHLSPSNYVDFQEFYKSKGFDFDWTVSEDRFSEGVNRILSTASKILSVDLRHYWEDDEWPYLKDTDLRETSAEELASRIASMPNKNLLDANEQSLLCHAVKAARSDLVRVALSAGVKGDVLALAAKLEGVEEDVTIEILELLIESGAALNNESVFSESPLEIAALRQQFKVVKYLLAKGAERVNPTLKYHPAIKEVLSSALSDFRAHSTWS